MKPIARIRVFTDGIPRVWVNVYFCRGLSENMDERPTSKVYIEIIIVRRKKINLEASRSGGTEAGAKGG